MKTLSLLVILGVGLVSCTPIYQTSQLLGLSFSEKSLSEAAADEALDGSLKSSLGALVSATTFTFDLLKFPGNIPTLKFQTKDRPAQTWKVTVVRDHRLQEAQTTFFLEKDEAQKFADSIKGDDLSFFIESQDSLAGLGVKTSPVLANQLKRPLSEQVEWINRQLLAALGLSDSKARFLAEKATLSYLSQTLSPSSLLVEQYLSEKRDERTFMGMFKDYRSRFENIYAQSPLKEDWKQNLDYLIKTWLQDYRSEYPNRFITSRYQWLWEQEMTDAQLAAWYDPIPEYSTWEAQYQKNPGDLKGLFIWLKNQPE